MSGVLDGDATSQLAALAARRVSAVELLKAALARHADTHGRLNAVVAADPERALERARALDEIRDGGEGLGPLAGLPMTVKDTLDVHGMPASSGLASLRRRQAEDATAVAHARRAGAVIWGKTNVPVMASDWQCANALYGVTHNPWDPTRTPGGSSGGAAAALAAGVTPLEIGSDIGGSLRIPAAFCGVFSHKPTWGMITQRGHVPPHPGSHAERDINVIGPMARSARDLRLLLAILENGPLAPRAPAADLDHLVIGLWVDEPGLWVDPEVRDALERFAAELSAAGARVEPLVSPVDTRALLLAYQTLLGAVIGEDMPPRIQRRMQRARALSGLMGGADDPFSARTLTRAYAATHLEWLAADAVRMRLRHDAAAVFDRVSVILAPAAPIAAFAHDRGPVQSRRLRTSNGDGHPYNSLLGWAAFASALHLPATTVPAGLTASGLPVSAQLIGPHGGDSRVLAIAQAIDENVRGFVAPPL